MRRVEILEDGRTSILDALEFLDSDSDSFLNSDSDPFDSDD